VLFLSRTVRILTSGMDPLCVISLAVNGSGMAFTNQVKSAQKNPNVQLLLTLNFK
jgi:hypothetical protein